MTFDEAKEILKDEINADDKGLSSGGWYVHYRVGDGLITLDGQFDPDSLEAMAVYIREMESAVGRRPTPDV